MNAKGITVLIGVAVAAFIAYEIYKGGKTLITQTLNPASDKNAAYSGINALGAAVTGNSNFSLGSAAFDWFHNPPAGFDPVQADKTCSVLYPKNGPKRAQAGSICAGLGY